MIEPTQSFITVEDLKVVADEHVSLRYVPDTDRWTVCDNGRFLVGGTFLDVVCYHIMWFYKDGNEELREYRQSLRKEIK